MRKLFTRLRFVLKIRRFIPFLIEFFRSKEVAAYKKIISMLFIVGYIVFPFDLIPDWLGIFGIIDDVTVLMFIFQQIVKMAPSHLKNKYGV
ncbi:YkvA family protein [Thermaerobacillus caldiproteolyticus]|uniref:YkvA family protein n=1 Tax=Thermaerobacillus caldiproteolyticus TaxID=247480 RepID=UPI00188A07A6|nr:DUF1232 domain-containing protein [Anoxybacillus caldiproteolyticus]QPA31514.1 DUF1232 domain-containing protein [Anoxybacillus caldiproteolyticus]